MNKLILVFNLVVYMLILSCDDFTKETREVVLEDTIVEENVGFTIPFELIDGRMVVSTMLNGIVPVKLAIDNGLNQLHLVEEFAKKYEDSLGIVLYPNVEAMGAFLSAPTQKSYVANGRFYYGFCDSIFVNYNRSSYVINGEYTEDFAYILVGDEVEESLPSGVVGIMPLQSFSKNGIFKINFKDKRLEFPETVDSLAVQYKFDDASRSMDFPIEFFGELDDKSYIFSSMLDLGYYGNLLIFGNKKVTQIIENMSRNYYLDVDIANKRYDKYRYFRNIKLGIDSVVFNDVETLYLKNTNGPADALIGIGIMSKYDIFFDYKNNYLYMKPLNRRFNMAIREFSITAGTKIRSVELNEKIKHVVGIIINDHLKLDVKLNDTILKIDNLSLENLSRDSAYKIFDDKNMPNKSMTIKRGDSILVLNRNQ